MPPPAHTMASPPSPASASSPPNGAAGHTPLEPGAFRAHAAEEHRRSFLRVVSHELRTPLNAIIGFSEIIARELYGPLNEPKYREHAELVRDSGLKLLKLVNDVLDIARLEAGASDLDLHPESLAAAAEEAIRAVTLEAERRGVTLVLDAPRDLPRVLADARGLSTIFANLLQNAVAHSPEGGVVEIVLTRMENEEAASLEVRDHGPGVDPADLPRILRPFEQVENALVRRADGAGLGLTIVGLLVDAMNGRLSLKSAKGEGFSATVRLPLVPPLQAV